MCASSMNLNYLTGIIDFNKWQATGRSQEILTIDPLADKWISFGWKTIEMLDENGNIIPTLTLESLSSMN